MAALENRRAAIDAELAQLAALTLSSGVGSVGYQSQWLAPDQEISLRIDLDKEHPIDQVILVPSLWRDTKTGLRSDGFPPEFRVLAGTATTTNLLASFTEEDRLLPRIAPLAINFETIHASWIQMQIRNPPTVEGNRTKHAVKLSEIMVFSGAENVALRKPVEADSSRNTMTQHENALVDGFVPYLMDAAHGEESQGAQLWLDPSTREHALSIDLGASYPIDQINLHAIDQSRTIPAGRLSDFAIPRRLRVTGANEADSSDETVLFDYTQKAIRHIGPIIMHRLPGTVCRYIHLTAMEPGSQLVSGDKNPMMAFSEIEIFSNGRNIAAGRKPAIGPGCKTPRHRSLLLMTDGRNYFGDILPVRQWMNELAKRHDLETERPAVVAELNRRYARQKTNLNRMYWLAALLASGIGFTILIDWNLRIRYVARIREQFSADLHDELGANIHTIGLLGDLARDAESHEELLELLDRSRVFTERSGAAVRYCTNMLEAKGLCEDLIEDMKRSSGRLLADIEHDLSFEDEEHLAKLKPRQRIGLFFFYKECLNNIIRHAGATQVITRLTGSPKCITLVVTDNGRGITVVPRSLKRRAHLLKGKLTSDNPESGGTRIELKLNTSVWRLFQ